MKTKHYILAFAVAIIGWLGASQINSVQAKYEQDVADYQAVVDNDSLPLQARMEKASRHLAPIELTRAAKRFHATESDKVEAASELVARNGSTIDRILDTAFRFIGVRYRSGQSGPNGFDCSGFTSYVYKQHNIQLTRSSRSQYTEGQPVAQADLKRGDLVFFGGARGGNRSVGHVGIVTEVDGHTGHFKFIHASTSSGIRVDHSTDAYYARRYVGARRILD